MTGNDDVRTAVSMRDLLNTLGYPIRGHGGYVRCFSGRHGDTHPSLKIYAHHLHCYGCTWHLDTVGFVMWHRKCSKREAELWLCEEAGIPPPAIDPERERVEAARDETSAKYEEVWAVAQADREPALTYLATRGIARTASEHRVGYLPPDYRPPDPEAAANAGLLSKGGHSLLAGRAVFPIRNAGRIVGFYGRAVQEGLEPKHICSGVTDPPMPPALWGLDEISGKEICLTEAPVDGLTLLANDLPAVSLTGAAKFSQGHVWLLKRHKIERATLAFDPDKAGQRGARAAGELLFRAGISVCVADLSEESAT